LQIDHIPPEVCHLLFHCLFVRLIGWPSKSWQDEGIEQQAGDKRTDVQQDADMSVVVRGDRVADPQQKYGRGKYDL
jgi:hypothetical protein